jgi:hypothetical protein
MSTKVKNPKILTKTPKTKNEWKKIYQGHGQNRSIKISNTWNAEIMHWVTYIGGHIPQDIHQKGSLTKCIFVFLM